MHAIYNGEFHLSQTEIHHYPRMLWLLLVILLQQRLANKMKSAHTKYSNTTFTYALPAVIVELRSRTDKMSFKKCIQS